jgi:uncharacterized protein (DUF1501 family)
MTTTSSIAATRRQALQGLAGFAALTAAPALWAQALRIPGQGRLVVVFLRGAYDGLSAFVPYADPDYARLRNSIAIPAPDGSESAALRLDASFGLHPALAPLLPLWQQGVFSFVPAAGSPDATRSHFEAQHHWETGIPGKNSDAPGWLNTLAGLQGSAGAAAAIGVGEANPQILAGAVAVKLIPKGQAATRKGALGDERTRSAVLNLYAGSDPLSQAFRAGADSRMQTAQTLDMAQRQAEMTAADNGAASAAGLLLDAQHLGTLMRQDRRLRLGFLSAGGWDTHANQGNATGALANNLGNLGRALAQLRRDFAAPDDVIVVLSEFGRTSAENGTRGTDHGHGNAMWLIGDGVQGGRWHGQWAGLASGNLHEGRDLPVLHDFRGVLAQVLRRSFSLSDTQLATVFPGGRWDAGLDGLMRA